MVRNLVRLIVLGLVVHAGVRIVPEFWHYLQFKDAVVEAATYAGRKTPEELKAAHCAFEQAKADELPYMVYAHMPIGVISGKQIGGLTAPTSATVGYHRAYIIK